MVNAVRDFGLALTRKGRKMKKFALIIAVLVIPFVASCGGARTQTDAQRGFDAILDENWSDAERYLNRALRNNPDNSYALLNLGWAYYQMGRRDLASEKFERVIQLDADLYARRSSDRGSRNERLSVLARENLDILKN